MKSDVTTSENLSAAAVLRKVRLVRAGLIVQLGTLRPRRKSRSCNRSGKPEGLMNFLIQKAGHRRGAGAAGRMAATSARLLDRSRTRAKGIWLTVCRSWRL